MKEYQNRRKYTSSHRSQGTLIYTASPTRELLFQSSNYIFFSFFLYVLCILRVFFSSFGKKYSWAKRLIPTLNRVLVEKIIPPSKTSAGILLPEKSPQLNSGKVIAVGPGLRDREGKVIPVGVKEGDTVLLPEYGGSQIKLDDKEYHLYRDEDILGTLHD